MASKETEQQKYTHPNLINIRRWTEISKIEKEKEKACVRNVSDQGGGIKEFMGEPSGVQTSSERDDHQSAVYLMSLYTGGGTVAGEHTPPPPPLLKAVIQVQSAPHSLGG